MSRIRLILSFASWTLKGRPLPPPASIKRGIVASYQRRYGAATFVETGTFRGDMVAAQLHNFEALYSIELDEELYRTARARFASVPKVHLLQGDSGSVLPDVLARVRGLPLFWLDGHYSGGDTACGEVECPIDAELDAIRDSKLGEFVLLIDDARLFRGSNGYPTLDDLRAKVERGYPGGRFENRHDVIRFVAVADRSRRSAGA